MASPHRRRLRPALVFTAVGVLVCAGCVRPAGGARTEEPNKVTVACGATEEWCAAMTAAFTAKTGIAAEFVRLSSGEAQARILAARDNPEFDVWHGGPADGYAAAVGHGLLERYVSPNAADIPARYKDADGRWTGVYVGVLGFCDNTRVLGEKRVQAPRSWQSLLDPALKQNVGIAHPVTSGTAYTALWTQVTLNGGAADAALRYMKQLHPNVLQYSKSGAAPAQQVARGEIGVGVVFSHDCVATREQGFTDLTVTFPTEGTGYEVGGVALIKGGPSPAAAKKYIDWALTPAAQEIGPTVRSYQAPTNPKAKRSDKAVDLSAVKLIDYDAAAAGALKSDLIRRFDAEVAQAPKS
ncbi:ABC transporter substrate-binding protein [Nonomuraea sp. NN258]|uniref:ABC transporter substrate-binding protein n=1 Tax=Nonomuraea antri TaxID=2730852 RepID=UPI001568F891|nr:ABC transporter substrate-binding protein [Nonomuraea antri]NRQ32796.1 ABC transporter substrate-binding protein [Nonomuraea antri]